MASAADQAQARAPTAVPRARLWSRASAWLVGAAFPALFLAAFWGILHVNAHADADRVAQVTVAQADSALQREHLFELSALGRRRVPQDVTDGITGARQTLTPLLAALTLREHSDHSPALASLLDAVQRYHAALDAELSALASGQNEQAQAASAADAALAFPTLVTTLVNSQQALAAAVAADKRLETLGVGGTLALAALARGLLFLAYVRARRARDHAAAQRLAATAVAERDAHFRLLFARHPQPMWIYDCSTRAFLEVNDAAVARYGYPRNAFLALTVNDLHLPEDIPQLSPYLAQPSGSYRSHVRHRTSDGRLIDVAVTSTDVPFNGRPARLVVAEDVTPRTTAETALHASQAQYRRIVETAQEGIWTIDAANVTTFVNARMAAMLGYTVDELVGQRAVFVAKEEQSRLTATLKQVRRGVAVQAEAQLRCKDGSALWVLMAGSPLYDEQGTYAGALAMMTDITARRQAEAARGELAAIVASSNDAIMGTTLDGIITSWNGAAEVLYGYTASEALGQPVMMLAPTDRAEEVAAFAARLQRGEFIQDVETQRRTKAGLVVDVSLTLSPMRDSAGQLTGVSAIVHDISERRRSELAIREGEVRYRQMFEGHQAITLIWDPVSDALVDANPAACAFYGYSRKTMQQLRLVDLSVATTAERTAERARAAAEQRPYLRFQHRLAAGTVRDMEAYTSSITVDGRDLRFTILHDVTERLRAERELGYLAYHDPLTGLANRALFLARLHESLAAAGRGPGTLAVLFLDLDGFKLVNDSLGHDVGDELLVAVGLRLGDCLRATDLLARFGGDEFTLLLADLPSREDAVKLAERLLGALRQPFMLGGRRRYITASIGIAYGRGAVSSRAEELMREADIALHQAKAAGKAQVAVYAPTMSASVRERLDLETDLRRALQRGELRLHYQPDVELASGQVTGVEALVRWQHPQRGLLPPAIFIPLAEETGLILPLGQWVLREACRQAQAWADLLPGGQPLVMSVNLSVQQLRDPQLVEQVARVLRTTRLDPACLRLEITESVLMEQVDQTLAALAALRALGVQLAIDDFGTGYSSLSYLAQLPVTTLKVDRSFIQRLGTDAGTAAIVDATVALAHALGMDVTAEGIEEPGQLAHLHLLRCDRGQGYYFARPMVPEAFPAFVGQGSALALRELA